MLDEPTSALDPHSESLIQESLTGAQRRADPVHRRPPHVNARHLRPRDGDHRRPAGRVRHDRPAESENAYYRSASALATGTAGAALSGRHVRRTSRVGESVAGAGARRTQARRVSRAGRLPDFFIVGHPKCGTTALYEMLSSHPGVYMPDDQGALVLRDRAARAHAAPPAGHRRQRSRSTSACSPTRGRASASARPRPTTCGRTPRRREIAKVQPDARIIAILREPASFLRSLHLQFVEVYYETEERSAHGARARGRAPPRAAAFPATPTGRSCCSTPSTSATSSSCAAITSCSRRSRCWS